MRDPRLEGQTDRGAGDLDLGCGHAHVGLSATANLGCSAFAVEFKHDALALTEHPKHRTLKRVGGEDDLAAVGVDNDNAFVREGIEELHDALHGLGLYDLASLDARCARIDTLRGALHNGANPLDVRVPATLVATVGV